MSYDPINQQPPRNQAGHYDGQQNPAGTYDNQQFPPQQFPYPQQQQQPYDPANQNYGPPPPPRRRFTREEMSVLKQCYRESFWYRSVPLAVGGVGGLFYLRSINKLPAKPSFAVLVFGTISTGYLAGKLSYLEKCKQKLLALPNSPLAEALKRHERGEDVIQEMAQLPQFNSDDYFRSHQNQNTDIYHDPDFAAVQPGFNTDSQDSTVPRQATSYDELRRRNREQYWRQQAHNVNQRSASQNGGQPQSVPPL